MKLADQIDIVNGWLSDLSRELETPLALNEEGLCSLQISSGSVMMLEISPDYPVLNFYSALIHLPAEDEIMATVLMRKALEYNAFQALTRGGSIALLPGSSLLVFCFNSPIEGLTSDLFAELLGNYIEALIEVKASLPQDEKPPITDLSMVRFKI